MGEREIKILIPAMCEAGDAILQIQKKGFSVERKANNDIVTQADLLANDILKSQLMKAFPDYGWLSEESVDDSNRLACERIWIVDPIDGTREYASGIPEYAISVALIEHGIPILSAVFNPAVNELYYALKNQGAWLGEKRIQCDYPPSSRLLLLASRSEFKRGEWDRYSQHHEVKQVGSIAYKLALIAAGQAHATFSLSPKNEWDIAGGVLLVEEAGGVVTDKQGSKLLFNQKNVLVEGVVAATVQSSEKVYSMIRHK